MQQGARQPPRVRRDDVAAGLDVAAVDVEHRGFLLDERARPPQALVDRVLGIAEMGQLGGGRAVENHADAGPDLVGDPTVLR